MKLRLSTISCGITLAAAMILTTAVGLSPVLAAGGTPGAPPPPTCGLASQPACPSAADLDFYHSIGGVVQGEYMFTPTTQWQERQWLSEPDGLLLYTTDEVVGYYPKGAGHSSKIKQLGFVSASGQVEFQTITVSTTAAFSAGPLYFEFYRPLERNRHAAKGTVPYVTAGATQLKGLVTSVQARSLAGWDQTCNAPGQPVCPAEAG